MLHIDQSFECEYIVSSPHLKLGGGFLVFEIRKKRGVMKKLLRAGH